MQKEKILRQKGFEQRFSLQARPKFDNLKNINDRRCSKSPITHSSYQKRRDSDNSNLQVIGADVK